MNLKAGLLQQQTLKLAMTQELTQAIALLQYSVPELTSFLENKALENPLMQIEYGNVQAMDPRKDRPKKTSRTVEKDKMSWIEQIGTERKTLEDFLFSQMNLAQLGKEDRKIVNALIFSLDENGYLCVDIEIIALKLGVSSEIIELYLNKLQELEPAGVGARTLKECLFIQLKRLPKRNELAEKIVSEYFTPFAEKKWQDVAKTLGVKLNQIQEVFDLVQTLTPRPASQFQVENPAYVIPDVVIKWDGEDFSISVFDETIPKVSFNHEYYNRFSAYNDQQVNRFLQEKQHDFYWIARSLEQRKETLTRVAVKIVEKQQDFFRIGPSFLKPMTMKDISEELGIHESTVSRAVREKYAQTPFGTFELKSFFTSTLKTTSNETASSQRVKTAISELISSESKQKPLSDQEIVGLLKKNEGIVVSRRTIAKYRDQLGIPSSSKRRRYD